MAELLIDEGISRDHVLRLRAQGFRIFHTLKFLPKGAHDQLVFLEAQHRGLTVFTWNRKDFVLLSEAWRDWGHGNHQGVISRPERYPQLNLAQTYPALEHYCRDASSYQNRIELF
jgi:uncharacterized protein DUF5615